MFKGGKKGLAVGIRMTKKLTGHHNLLNKQSVDGQKRMCCGTFFFVYRICTEFIVCNCSKPSKISKTGIKCVAFRMLALNSYCNFIIQDGERTHKQNDREDM